jgi:ribonuclease P protein component
MLYDFIDESEFVLQGGVAVSSRNFKKAVERNRVKRMLREAYRLQKDAFQNILTDSGKTAIVFFIYTGKNLPVFSEVKDKVSSILQRLSETLIKKHKD